MSHLHTSGRPSPLGAMWCLQQRVPQMLLQDMQDFEALTHRLFFDNSNVRRFRTSVVMGRTKVGLSLPI